MIPTFTKSVHTGWNSTTRMEPFMNILVHFLFFKIFIFKMKS